MTTTRMFPVLGLSGSVSAPCDIMHLVLRSSSQPPKYIHSAPSITEGSSRLLHDAQKIVWLTEQGRITLLANEAPCMATDGGMAFVARPSFLTAYEALCKEPFPWQEFKPVGVQTPSDSEEERQKFPVLLRGLEEKLLATQTQAAVGPVESLLELCRQATRRILQRGHDIGHEYLSHPTDSPQWFDALDRMKEIGWLAALCTPKPDVADLLVEAYAFTGLSILERQGEQSALLKSLFNMGIRPFHPELPSKNFFDYIKNMRTTLTVQKEFKNSQIILKPVIPKKEYKMPPKDYIKTCIPLNIINMATHQNFRQKNENI
ncbi:MAG: hypothetical protein HQL96_02970 [Magnetococcales bacterium]|nr:hypothetical protein [Magnetococcales bacterium]